jgi:hypothetical protein
MDSDIDEAPVVEPGRTERWLTPHPYHPAHRYIDLAIDPWHYTDLGGLEGILSSNVLWATESGGLNDPSEVVRAAESLLKEWKASLDQLKPHAPIGEADTWLRKITDEVAGRRFFFVSACFDGDKLQHWKTYAGGRGYAIELKRNTEYRLLQADSGQPLYWPGFAPAPWWRAVTYGDYENGRSARGGSLLWSSDGIMEHVLNEFAARERGNRPDETAFWEHLEANYLRSVCFNKHEAYAEEEETRLAFIEPPFLGYVHQRAGGYGAPGSTSYIKAAADPENLDAYSTEKAPRLPIRSVRIGPRYGTELDREIRQVTDLLRDNGYEDVQVTASKIPYRG